MTVEKYKLREVLSMNCPHCNNSIADDSKYCNYCGLSPYAQVVQKKQRSGLFYILCVVGVLLVLYLFLRQTVGSNQANRVVAAVAHTPIVLDDETQNLRASSWRAIPLNTPYNGSLDVNLRVVRGNPLDVILIEANQLNVLQNNGWGNVLQNPNFQAEKTATYHRTAPVGQGSYYLVFRDTSLGILSSSSTDVAVKAALNP